MPLGVAGIPVQARGQRVLPIGARDGPPPPRGHGLLVGGAHARTPRGQVGDASRVADVEDGRGLLVRGRASTGRALFPVGDVDVDARGSQEDGGAGVPPDARPSQLGGHLSRAPQRAFGAVPADDAEEEASPGWAEARGARVTREPSPRARPGHTAARQDAGGVPVSGSEASTRARAAPSHPRRRRRARLTHAIAQTHARRTTMAAPTRSVCAPGTRECRRQAMSTPMTTMETKGAPRRREDAEKAPRPRRSTTGQATARGRGRTSRTSPPIRALRPAARRARAPRRRHGPRRVRTLTGVAPGKVRRRARPSRVEKSACSRATLAHDGEHPRRGPPHRARERARRRVRPRTPGGGPLAGQLVPGNPNRSCTNDRAGVSRLQAACTPLWIT